MWQIWELLPTRRIWVYTKKASAIGTWTTSSEFLIWDFLEVTNYHWLAIWKGDQLSWTLTISSPGFPNFRFTICDIWITFIMMNILGLWKTFIVTLIIGMHWCIFFLLEYPMIQPMSTSIYTSSSSCLLVYYWTFFVLWIILFYFRDSTGMCNEKSNVGRYQPLHQIIYTSLNKISNCAGIFISQWNNRLLLTLYRHFNFDKQWAKHLMINTCVCNFAYEACDLIFNKIKLCSNS